MPTLPVDLSNINQRPPDGLGPEGKPYRILVVDDSKFVIKQITQILTSEKYDICGAAEDGAEGVALYKELKPDLVTMDITMPQMDGLTCIGELLKIKPTARIVVISALSDSPTGIKALRLGAKAFLPKPFTEKQIVDEISSLLGLTPAGGTP